MRGINRRILPCIVRISVTADNQLPTFSPLTSNSLTHVPHPPYHPRRSLADPDDLAHRVWRVGAVCLGAVLLYLFDPAGLLGSRSLVMAEVGPRGDNPPPRSRPHALDAAGSGRLGDCGS